MRVAAARPMRSVAISRSSHNCVASGLVRGTVPRRSNRPVRRAFSPACPDNAPTPAPSAGAGSSAHARHAVSSVPDLYISRVDLNFDSRAHRQRRRVEVGQHPYAAALVDLGKMQRGQIEAFCSQRQQMLALGQHRCTIDRPRPAMIRFCSSSKPDSRSRFSPSRSCTFGTGTRWLRGTGHPRPPRHPSRDLRPACRTPPEIPSASGRQ